MRNKISTTLISSLRSRITAKLKVKFLYGAERGQEAEADYDDQLANAKLQRIKLRDILVIGKIDSPEGVS